jgi:hypothetical protein
MIVDQSTEGENGHLIDVSQFLGALFESLYSTPLNHLSAT